MKPFINLAETRLPDGTTFSLHKHDGKFYLKYNGMELMSTAFTHSEQRLAEMACTNIVPANPKRPKHPRILIGGLGMGFTLKRTLEIVGRPATIEVVELVPEIIEWNRTFLAEHNGPLLDDDRTHLLQGDLFDMIANDSSYDVIMIDIDDTPEMLITEENDRLYTNAFLSRLRHALKPEGTLAYWLAMPAPKFEKALIKAGFHIKTTPVKSHEKAKRPRHFVCVARRR